MDSIGMMMNQTRTSVIWTFVMVVCLLVCRPVITAGQEPGQIRIKELDSNDLLTEEQLRDVSCLMERYRKVGVELKLDGDFLERIADRKMDQREWGSAAKAYFASATSRPTVRRLLRLALAKARLPSDPVFAGHDLTFLGFSSLSPAKVRALSDPISCEEEIQMKLRALHSGLETFRAAVAFHEALGEESDVEDRNVGYYLREILESQRMLFELQVTCVGPEKRGPSPYKWGTAK